MAEQEREEKKAGKMTRKQFLAATGGAVLGGAVGGAAGVGVGSALVLREPVVVQQGATPGAVNATGQSQPVTADAGPDPQRWLVIDRKKCTGCMSCMLACSQAHFGEANLSKARVQILADPFAGFPTDIIMSICRHCENPPCYEACPLPGEAFRIDPENGLRYIDPEKCVGCRDCVEACHFMPSRVVFDPVNEVAFKCDLCRDTPYWDSQGLQACVQTCPMGAIQITTVKPKRNSNEVNLRGEGWASLDLPSN